MKFCPRCGDNYPEIRNSCPHCGAPEPLSFEKKDGGDPVGGEMNPGILRLLSLLGIEGRSFSIKACIAYFLACCSPMLISIIFFFTGNERYRYAIDRLPLNLLYKGFWVAGLVLVLIFVKTKRQSLLALSVAIVSLVIFSIAEFAFGNVSAFGLLTSFVYDFFKTLFMIIFLRRMRHVWLSIGMAMLVTGIILEGIMTIYMMVEFSHFFGLDHVGTNLLMLVGRIAVFSFSFWLIFKIFGIELKPLEHFMGQGYSPAGPGMSQANTGVFGPEKKGLKLGAVGGIAMMAIAVVWFVVGWSVGYIFYYPPILFAIGLFGFVKGIVTKNIAGRNDT